MTTPLSPPSCPECAGPQMTGHPAGPLAIRHTIGCGLLHAEDATRAADYDRSRCLGMARFDRPITGTELLLITALGLPAPPDDVMSVCYLTTSARRRSWTTPKETPAA